MPLKATNKEMYVKYFKFKGKPFGINPDPKFFFNSKTHKRALSCLGYGLGQGQGFVIITGDSGTGKTTLMSALSHMLANTNIITASIINTQLQDDEMLRYVAAELGLPFEGVSKVSLLKSIEVFFSKCLSNNNRVIIIIDESQNISDSAIEELRMLMNLVKGNEAVLQFVLFGQNSLKQHLLSDLFESIRQRTVASYELTNLGEAETKAYITLRLRAVGWVGDPEISPGAYLAIYESSEGIPAKINMICGKLLQAASVKGSHLIIEEDVQNIDREMNHNFSDYAFSGSLVEGVVDAIMGQRMKKLADRKSVSKESSEMRSEPTHSVDKVKPDSDETSSVEIVDVESKLTETSLESASQKMKPASDKISELEIPEAIAPETTQDLVFETHEITELELSETLELTAPELLVLDETIGCVEEETLRSDVDEIVITELGDPTAQEMGETFEIEQNSLDDDVGLTDVQIPIPEAMDNPESIIISEADTLNLGAIEAIEHEGTFSVDTDDLSDERFEFVAADSFDMEELESIVASDADTLELESAELLQDEISIQKTIESLEVPAVDDLELIGLDESEDSSDTIPMISEQVSSEQAFMETSELHDSGEVDTEIQEWLQKKKESVNGSERINRVNQTGEISVNDFESTLEDHK